MTLEEHLEKIEAMLVVLVERQQVREWYSVEEFAQFVRQCGVHLPRVVPARSHSCGKETVAGVLMPHGRFPMKSCSDTSEKGCCVHR